jgi:hypothetical protein
MKTAVIVSRNDNYGGNLVERATLCLENMCQVFSEVIYVDWNSPGESLLVELPMRIPSNLVHIHVTPAMVRNILNKLPNGDEAADCCEVLGRNIGITRASHPWIVSTNIDIIPTPFNEEGLNYGTFYTVPRYDVPKEFWLKNSVTQQSLEQNKANFGRKKFWDRDSFSLIEYCGDFQVAHRIIWEKIMGFEEKLLGRCYADSHVQMKAKWYGFQLDVLDIPIYHLDHYNLKWYGKQITCPRNNIDCLNIDKFKGSTNNVFWGQSNNPQIFIRYGTV